MAAQPIPTPATTDWEAVVRRNVERHMAELAAIPEQCGRCGQEAAEWHYTNTEALLKCQCGEVLYAE